MEKGTYMDTINIGDYILQVDREKTLAFYENYKNVCNCASCVHYRKLLKHIPKEALDLYETLGVIPGRECEIVEYGPDEKNEKLHYYEAVSGVVGTIIKLPNTTETIVSNKEQFVVEKMPKLNEVEYEFSEWFDFIPKEFPAPKFAVQLFFNLPV